MPAGYPRAESTYRVGLGLDFEMDDGEVEKLAVQMRAHQMLLGGWRRRRAAEQLALAASPRAVTELARALAASSDQRVVEIADMTLRELSDQGGIDAACQVWEETRDATLGALLVEHGWVASQPQVLRVSTALHAGRMDGLVDGDAQVARALATVEEEDPALRVRARDALRALRRPEAREAVCALAIDQANSVALEAALAGDFASDPVRRAVLLYLAGEFDRYAELDFDGRLLAAAHATAADGLRARLAERARESGRVEWVRAIAGRQARRLEQLSDNEWDTAIAVLVAAGQWAQLWQLALRAPPIWGVRMLDELGHRDWRPPTGAEQAIHHQLTTLGSRAIKLPASSLYTPPFEETTVLENNAPVNCVVVSPDGRLLASGSWDGSVRLWRLPLGEPAGTLTGHTGWVRCLAVSPDSGLLASGSDDGTVRLWRLPSGESAGTLIGHWHYVRCLAVSPDGGLLVSGSDDGTVRLWRLPLGESAGTLIGHTSPVHCLAVSPDGELLASGSWDGVVRLWRLPSGEPASVLTGHTSAVQCLVVSPDGRLLASGSWDGSVRLWRLPLGEPAGTLTGHTGWVRCLAVSPDSGLLASGSDDRTVRLWLQPSGEPAGTLTDHTLAVQCLVVSPDGQLLASGSADGTVRLWRLPSGKTAGTLTGHRHYVRCVAVSPDGGLLASGSGDGTARLWQAKLVALSRTPVDQISFAEVELLRPPTGEHPVDARAWVELITALVRWRHRHDIEVDAAPGSIEVGEWDIELES